MNKNKFKKILTTTLILGIPVSIPIISNNKAKAMIGKNISTITKKLMNTTTLIKPSTSIISKKIRTNNVKTLVNKFNNLGISNKNNSSRPSILTSLPGKLSPNAGNHLSLLFENETKSPSITTTKPSGISTTSGKLQTNTQSNKTQFSSITSNTSNTPGKLSPNAGSHLSGLFGNKGTSLSTTNKSGKLSTTTQNTETQVPLTFTTTPSIGTTNIPEAPPLPPGGIISPVKYPTTPITNTTNNNKTNSNLTLSTNKTVLQQPAVFMDELKTKLTKMNRDV